MKPSASEHISKPVRATDNHSEDAVQPGYIVRPTRDSQFLVPTVLAEENLSLAAVEAPQLSTILEHDAGVSY